MTVSAVHFPLDVATVRPQGEVSPPPSVTVVCCVESGPLEPTTLMMIESLRRWGGRFANVPVIAVTPRFGPPLSRATRRRLDELNVRYVRKTITRQYAWYSFLNKPLSLVIAEEFVNTETVVWLDADVFVTGEPDAFDLDSSVDFSACPSDRNLGSTGRDDRYERYWSRMCDIHGVSLEALPWVKTCRERMRIRLYFNGGVLVYRRDTGYGPAYLQGCIDALNARVRSNDAGLFFAEQVTAGLIAVRNKLKLRLLPEQCNYAVGSKCDGFEAEAFSQARVLHYHDALWDHFFPQFLDMCRTGQPALYEWIKSSGPLSNGAPFACRILSKTLKTLRAHRAAAFEETCDKC